MEVEGIIACIDRRKIGRSGFAIKCKSKSHYVELFANGSLSLPPEKSQPEYV